MYPPLTPPRRGIAFRAFRSFAPLSGGAGSGFDRKLFLAIAALLCGCATAPKVQTQAKPGADYSRYHTFALMPLPASPVTTDPGMMLRLVDPARQAVITVLRTNGFTQTELAQADLAVNLRGQSLPKVQVTDWGYQPMMVRGRRGRYYGYGGYRDIDVRNYEERTLSIEIFDNQTKDLVWVGWATTTSSKQFSSEEIQETIQRILADFPPQPESEAAKQ